MPGQIHCDSKLPELRLSVGWMGEKWLATVAKLTRIFVFCVLNVVDSMNRERDPRIYLTKVAAHSC